MKPAMSRLAAATLLAILLVVISGASAKKGGPALQPNKLIILSTTDVKGKTSPCG